MNDRQIEFITTSIETQLAALYAAVRSYPGLKIQLPNGKYLLGNDYGNFEVSDEEWMSSSMNC